MVFSIRFNEEKNQILKATRGIGFEELGDAIVRGDMLADIVHPSLKRPKQRMYVVKIDKYAVVVSYVINHRKREIFLKTIYPSRKLTRIYLKERRKS